MNALLHKFYNAAGDCVQIGSLKIGDRVIIKATGKDGRIEDIDYSGRIYVYYDLGPCVGKLEDFTFDELEFWS